MTIVNSFSVRMGTSFGYFFNFGKIMGILLIIVLGIYGLVIGRNEAFKEPFENTSTNPGNYGIALVAGYFSYTGWQSLGNIVGEIKNPNKTLPLSIFVALVFCISVYFLTNVAFFTFLSPKEVMNSNVVAFVSRTSLLFITFWIVISNFFFSI